MGLVDGKVVDITGAASLTFDRASMVTGAIVPVDGGPRSSPDPRGIGAIR
jgi:hypothetical protein